MKMLKKIVVVFTLMAMLPSSALAQNSKKNRCDNENCVFEILEKLNSEDKTVVAEAEKSLDSIARDAAFTCDSNSKKALINSIIPFVKKFNSCESNEYLFSLLPLFCNKDDAPEILKFVEIESLADYAIRTVGEIPGCDDIIEKYIVKNHDDLKYKPALAYAVGKLNIVGMENELISWLDDGDNATKIEVYNALLVIGTSDKTTKIVAKGAKKLYKSKNTNEKIAGMQLLVALNGEKALPKLFESLKNNDKSVRIAALDLMKPYANQEVVKKVMKKCKKGDAMIDAIDWLGDIKDDSQMEFLLKQLASENKAVVRATIRAIFKINNADGINAVKPLFGGEYQDVIKESMVAYEGDYRAVMNDVFRGNDIQKLAAFEILESRNDLGLYNRVRELVVSENQQIRDKAFSVLPYVVTISSIEQLSYMLESCDEKNVEQVQLAIKNVMKNANEEQKDLFASMRKHVKPEIMPRFYNLFAYFGTKLCVDKLIDAYQNGDYKFEAKEALLLVENEQFKAKIQEVLN